MLFRSGDWYQAFEDECMAFPRSRHDDQVDSLAYLGLLLDKMIEAPTKAEQEEEQYQEEYGDELNDDGRNEICGY